MPVETTFLILLLLVAMLYAIVGHGGASGYIALMVMFAFSFTSIKPTALILNIVVSLLGFLLFYKAGYFKWKLFWPLILTSVPAAFVGGFFKFNQPFVNNVLAVILLYSSIQLVRKNKVTSSSESIEISKFYLLAIGALVGFLSGMLGIGGGIILSPLLILFKGVDARSTAAISAPFIFFNSASGLIAFSVSGGSIPPNIFAYVAVVMVGGLIGSTLGSKGVSLYGLRLVLAGTVAFAAFKLISI
ncbi:MAG: sulfite exporter TauE/SafE family protein [Paludibacter sp.]|nr:sulfite exporter TauE/SafE family protein [Paludibacter sp.]